MRSQFSLKTNESLSGNFLKQKNPILGKNESYCTKIYATFKTQKYCTKLAR